MLKACVVISYFLFFLFILGVVSVTANKAIVYISYSDYKCVATSTVESSCDDFYNHKDNYLIQFI